MPKGKSGLTLIEVLIAVGILALGLGGLLFLFSACIVMNENSRDMTSAISHAEFALEDVKHSAAINPLSVAGYNGLVWNAATLAAVGLTTLANESITFTSVGGGPYTVTATVLWQERNGRARSLALNTVVKQ